MSATASAPTPAPVYLPTTSVAPPPSAFSTFMAPPDREVHVNPHDPVECLALKAFEQLNGTLTKLGNFRLQEDFDRFLISWKKLGMCEPCQKIRRVVASLLNLITFPNSSFTLEAIREVFHSVTDASRKDFPVESIESLEFLAYQLQRPVVRLDRLIYPEPKLAQALETFVRPSFECDKERFFAKIVAALGTDRSELYLGYTPEVFFRAIWQHFGNSEVLLFYPLPRNSRYSSEAWEKELKTNFDFQLCLAANAPNEIAHNIRIFMAYVAESSPTEVKARIEENLTALMKELSKPQNGPMEVGATEPTDPSKYLAKGSVGPEFRSPISKMACLVLTRVSPDFEPIFMKVQSRKYLDNLEQRKKERAAQRRAIAMAPVAKDLSASSSSTSSGASTSSGTNSSSSTSAVADVLKPGDKKEEKDEKDKT